MFYRCMAELVVLFHFCFIVFVLFGALLLLRWRKLVWLHLPALAWGIIVEWCHLMCPLTHWENYFRDRAGVGMYEGGFIDRYLTPIIYPRGLTSQLQVLYGCIVATINLSIYIVLIRRYRATQRARASQKSNLGSSGFSPSNPAA